MKLKRFEIEDDGQVEKVKVKKENPSGNTLTIEKYKDNQTEITNRDDSPSGQTSPPQIQAPDGTMVDLLFGYTTGSRWVYINGKWYKIG